MNFVGNGDTIKFIELVGPGVAMIELWDMIAKEK